MVNVLSWLAPFISRWSKGRPWIIPPDVKFGRVKLPYAVSDGAIVTKEIDANVKPNIHHTLIIEPALYLMSCGKEKFTSALSETY
jgi:hypothetical protein